MEKNENKKIYEVPKYIEDLIKKIGKTEEKLCNMLEQIHDYMTFKNIPLGTPLNLLKFVEEDVIEGQESMVFD